MKEDKHKIKLVYPDEQADILLEQEDQQLNRQDEIIRHFIFMRKRGRISASVFLHVKYN